MSKLREFLKEKLGKENLKKIESYKIGIAGCGGLGSNCAFNLVRSGFIKLKLIDFDIIDDTNLNRQFYFSDQVGMAKVEALSDNLKRINKDIELDLVQEKLEESNIEQLFGDCDIVVEAFDKSEYKGMIVSKLIKSNKFIVSASGLCGVGNSDDIKVHRIKKNLVIIGDLESGVDKLPPLSPRVNVAAAKQADVILEYVIGEKA